MSFLRNTAFNAAAQLTSVLVGAAAIPVITRTYTPAEFGILGLAWVLLGSFSIFDLGLSRAVAQRVAAALAGSDREVLRDDLRTALALHALFGLLGGAVLAAVSPVLANHALRIAPGLRLTTLHCLLLLSLSVPAVVVGGMFRGILEGANRFDLVNLVRAPISALLFAIPAASGLLHVPLVHMIAVLVIVRMANPVIYATIVRRSLADVSGHGRFSRRSARALFVYGGWVSISNLATPILMNADRLIVGISIGMTGLGYYTSAYEAATKLWIISMSVGAVLFPAFSAADARDSGKTPEIYFRSFRGMLVVLTPAVVFSVVLAPQILGLLLSRTFVEQSILPFRIICIGVLVNSLANIPFTHLQGVRRPDVAAKIHLAEIGPFIAVVWLLSARFGIVGASVAWALRAMLDATFQFVASWRIDRRVWTRLRCSSMYLTFTICGAFCIIVAPIATTVILPLVWKLSLYVALFGAFAAAIWQLSLDDADRKAVSATFTRRLGALG